MNANTKNNKDKSIHSSPNSVPIVKTKLAETASLFSFKIIPIHLTLKLQYKWPCRQCCICDRHYLQSWRKAIEDDSNSWTWGCARNDFGERVIGRNVSVFFDRWWKGCGYKADDPDPKVRSTSGSTTKQQLIKYRFKIGLKDIWAIATLHWICYWRCVGRWLTLP